MSEVGRRAGAAAVPPLESGTGKELLAKALHQNSLRAGKLFITVNCSALPAGDLSRVYKSGVKVHCFLFGPWTMYDGIPTINSVRALEINSTPLLPP